jgi:peptide/nickel transport system permease protein
VPVLRLVAGRILLSLLTLLIVSLIVFAVLEILPGDVATRILGRDATPESLALLRAKLGLGDPAPLRYLHWLGGLLSGDAGQSLVSNRPVTEILGPRIYNTVLLSIYAFLLYVPLTVVPALIQAIRRDRPLDHGLSVVTLVLLSMPDFLLATILLFTFVVLVPVLPAISLVDHSSSAMDYLRAMTLPALTLAIVMAVYAVRMLRDNLIEVLDSDYVRMAELKGLSARRVLLRHALPNALVTTVTIIGLEFGVLLAGAVVTEKVFAWPGIGLLMLESIRKLDVPVVQGVVLVTAAGTCLATLAADALVRVLDPRVR